MLPERVEIEFEDVTLTMLHEKALLFKDEGILTLSDVHLGKLEHFRKNGVAVPVVTNDLDRINLLINKYQPEKLVFLGDLFHSGINSSAERFKSWRNQHSDVAMILIEGNHDILSDNDYQSMDIQRVDKMSISNLTLQHHPDDDKLRPVICGHIHPGVLLQGTGKQSLRLPCFYKTGNQLILPAFGSTTGLFTVKPGSDSEVFAITPSGIAYYSAMEKI